jgi:hypothetical protein
MNLIEAIHLGLRRGYYQYKRFGESLEGFEHKMTEYLLTVFVAIEVNQCDFKSGTIYTKPEYPLWQFYTSAFPSVKLKSKTNIFDRSEFIRRKYIKKATKERIDIAILKGEVGHLRIIHGIELKAINSNYEGVIKDLKRLSESMITTDKSDSNSISSCYSGFIKSYKKVSSPIKKTELEKLRQRKLKEVEQILDTDFRNKKKYQKLTYTVHYSEIDSVSSEEYLGRSIGIPDELPDYSDAANNTGEVLGIVIEIQRT